MMNLGEQLSSTGNNPFGDMKKTGLVLAVVTNITDPDSLGRLKCRPITDDEDVAETDWCFCMAPAAGNGYGVFYFPQVNDLVVLGYLGGDIHHPLVLGSYWAGESAAPYKIEDGKNELISIKTPTGSELKFEEEADKQKITITTPSGAVIKIDDEAKTILVEGDADNSLTLNWGSGEIALKAKTKLTLSAGDTELVLESSGNLSGTASQKISAEAANIELAGSSKFAAEGATAEVKSSGQLTLQASGMTTVKGATVQIN